MTRILSLFVVFMLSGVLAFSQKQVFTGQVKGEDGTAASYATVSQDGAKNIVKADENGNFTISGTKGSTLMISASGYLTESVKANTSILAVTLKRNKTELQVVTVATSFGQQRSAKSFGSSSTTISSKDLVVAKPISVVNGLTGKVAGLQINTTNNGLFAPTHITLRASRSLKGNNEPLVVVDGAIFYNDINTLNPEDIANVNVLKGSSAAAIYGSDASNGVLVITTKKGNGGKGTLTFGYTAQFEKLSYLMKLQEQFGSNGGEVNVDDINDLSTYIPYENQGYGPRYNGKMVPLGRPLSDGSLLLVPYSPIPNQKRNFFQNGVTNQYNLSYTGGDEYGKFLLSMQHLSTTAIMPGDGGKRDVFRGSGNRKYGAFSANYSATYTRITKSTTNTQGVYQNVLQTQAHVPLSSLKDWKNNKFADVNGYFNDYARNPYWDIDNVRFNSVKNDLTGNIALGLKLSKGVNISYRLAATNSSFREEFTQNSINYSNYALTNPTVIYSNSDGTGLDTVIETAKYLARTAGVVGNAASYYVSGTNNTLITSDFLANIEQKLTNSFDLKLTLGASYVNNKFNSSFISAPSLILPVYNINNVSGSPTTGGANFNAEAAKQGYFGDLTLGFKDYAFLHGSYRTDKDSRLSKKNAFIPYYDVDAALVISDLIPSLRDEKNRFLNFAKIRAAYSVTGNVSALGNGSKYIALGAYTVNPTYNVANGFPYGNLGGYNISTTIANPDLKPESVNEKEIGIELGLFKNKLNISFVNYKSFTKDGIVPASVATSTGFTNALVNAANLENIGYETEVKATIVKSKNFNWNVGVNYTYNKSTVQSINGDLKELSIGGTNGNAFAIVGEAYPSIKSRDWQRDADGKVIVDAITGLPKATSNIVNLGNAAPTDIIGINSNITWKNITFSATVDYRGGYKIFNSVGQYTDFTGVSATSASTNRQQFVFPNSVTVDGSGKSTPNTNILTTGQQFDFWPGLYSTVGSNYVTSAAAWKVREIALTYQFPNSLFGNSKLVKAATLTFSGRNLFMFVPKTNVWGDPEFSDDETGNGFGRSSTRQAPSTRIFGVSFQVTF